MSLDPTRIRTDHNVWALAALDTIPLLTERVQEMLSNGRRITLITRWMGRDDTPKVACGLTVDEVTAWGNGCGLGVHLKPGIAGFSFSSDEATESEVRQRFNGGDRKDLTEVEIHGGTHGPGREDHIVIRRWNMFGVGEEKVVAFDLGDTR